MRLPPENTVAATVAAIDVGGTFIKGGLVAPGGAIEARQSVPTLAHEGHRAVVERIAGLGRELAAAQAAAGAGPRRLGVVIPGLVDERRGIAIRAANLDWADYPIAEVLSRRIGLSVAIGHDVAAGALAEYRYGAAAGAEVAVVAAIGTGVAAGLICRGRPYRGAHGRVLELGHLRLAWSDEPCGCGGRGCLERVAAASAIAIRHARAAGLARPLDAKQVQALARRGDPIAAQVWADAVRALAQGLATVVTLADPDRIVVAGGLSRAGDSLLTPLRAELAGLLTLPMAPAVVAARLGSDAGLVGAAIAAGLESDPRDLTAQE
ncbi:MAG: ROK family protein [Bifidobacteriaceae bacterium]|jgi:glucokinase|nr:ROK family protein [Bifidobacteriaceae bacterium]